MGYFITIPIPFDVLDAAFADKLPLLTNWFISFKREVITNGSVAYKLSEYDLGQIGEFRLRKLNNLDTELFVRDPRLEIIRKPTEEELNNVSAGKTADESDQLYLELIRKLHDERDELRQKRIDYLHKVASNLLSKVNNGFGSSGYLQYSFLAECLDDFVFFIQAEVRMSFWQLRNNKRKWIEYPEKHAKLLLRTYLAGRYGQSLDAFEEINAGAGRIDIYVVSPQGEKAIIELKMCGHRYSSRYAQYGFTQLKHYMKNKKAENGYLLVFDSRRKDFSNGFNISKTDITAKIIDVRYNL